MADFVRARNEELGVEKVLPRSALPYLAGWEAVDADAPTEPVPPEVPDAGAPSLQVPSPPPPSDEPSGSDTAAPVDEPVTPGSTPVGRPTRKPKES
jgi:hypothetical protein